MTKHRGPWQLVNAFETLVQNRTGVRPTLNEGQEGVRQRKQAKNIINAAGSYGAAMDVIGLYAEDLEQLSTYPSVMTVASRVHELIFKTRLAQRNRPDAPRKSIKLENRKPKL
jgi:hypothetical protein